MTSSSIQYHPSLLEQAQSGDFRAIGLWISTLLGPYGIRVSATKNRSGCLTLWLNFRRPLPMGQFTHPLRHRLVRFICYRLWTLNSGSIYHVRIVARIAGESDILWQQSVRINTPAIAKRVRRPSPSSRPRELSQLMFQMVRSLFVNRVAIAGFFFSYWAIYLQISGRPTPEPTVEASRPLEHHAEINRAVLTDSQPMGNTPLTHALTFQPDASVTGNLDFPANPSANVMLPGLFQGKVLRQVALAHSEKLVALTFDDGPWPETTEKVLEILSQFNVKATFFMVGLHVQSHPGIAQKVAAAGHAIGNHTWRHRLENLDQLTAVEEINNAARLIYEATGVRTHLFRPPGGNLSGELVPYAQQSNYATLLWSADSQDYFASSPLIIDNVLKEVKPGGIVLLHDGGGDRMATVEALPQILTALKHQGYQFVTVPQLLEIKAQQEQQLAAKRTSI